MQARDTVLTINVVEPSLVRALEMHNSEREDKLKGIVLTHTEYAEHAPNRPKDTTGLFEEIICDFNDPDALQKALKPFQYRLAAAHCRFENSMHRFQQIIPFVPYVDTPTETSILWSTHKPLMRDRLHSYDPNLVPKYQNITEKDLPELSELISGFTYPLIVKPSNLAASLLVTRCENKQELDTCLDDTFKVIHEIYAREHRTNQPSLLIEEMMQGDMYSIDGYVSSDGEIYCLPLIRVVTAHEVGLPGFYTYQTVVPTGLPVAVQEAAKKVAEDSIRALNLSTTTVHIELFLTPDGWKIVELGARIGGHRESLYREAYGVEHFYNDLAIRMGMKPKMHGNPVASANGFQIYASDEGIIESIEGVDEARKLDSVVWMEVHSKPGNKALFADKGGNTIVDGVLSNKDPEQLARDLAKVRELVKINVKKN